MKPVRLPIDGTLDLHAFPAREARAVVEDYIEAAHDAALTEVRVIHGRGRGVQRSIVHSLLARHPLVLDHWDAPDSHLGATIARLVPESATDTSD